MSPLRATAVLAAVELVASCQGTSPAPASPLGPEAAFVELAPRDVTLKGQSIHLAATARIFTNLRRADDGARDRPVFVLFNGFASEVVRSFGTGPMTVAEGGAVEPNPSPLTRVANLLYVDPRQAGYSYDRVPGGAPSANDCGGAVFNEYVDAADVLLAVLAFLDAHPDLRGPVYWLGESYAGVRIQWILAYLRARWDLASYRDPALEAAIARSSRGAALRAGQILIQPWLAGGPHAGAIAAACNDPALLADVAASVGAACASISACACAADQGRSLYNYAYTVTRQEARELDATTAHVTPDRAAALLGVPLDSVAGLDGAERALGFKCAAPDASTPRDDALQALLGPLPPGQAYFLAYSPLQPGKETAPVTRDWQTAPFEGLAFVDNLHDVPTFVTDGERDLVVPTRALVPGLRAVIDPARVDPVSGTRLGVVYPDGERFATLGIYPSAGHQVTMIEADAFARDVTQWLAALP